MKNSKELSTLLTSIHCINFTGSRDSDIHNIVEYSFKRLFGANTNLITLACIGKTKEQMMPEIMHVLELDTQYKKHFEEIEPMKLKAPTVYTVLVDWVNDSGDDDTQAYLFSTLEKAKAHLRKEALADLEAYRGDEVYCDEGCDTAFVKELRDEFDDDFGIVDSEDLADWVVLATPTLYSSCKQGRYAEDHFNVRIVESVIDEIKKEEK